MVMRQMGLVWGVYPLLAEKGLSTDDVFEKSVQSALDMDYISSGDLVVITISEFVAAIIGADGL